MWIQLYLAALVAGTAALSGAFILNRHGFMAGATDASHRTGIGRGAFLVLFLPAFGLVGIGHQAYGGLPAGGAACALNVLVAALWALLIQKLLQRLN